MERWRHLASSETHIPDSVRQREEDSRYAEWPYCRCYSNYGLNRAKANLNAKIQKKRNSGGVKPWWKEEVTKGARP